MLSNPEKLKKLLTLQNAFLLFLSFEKQETGSKSLTRWGLSYPNYSYSNRKIINAPKFNC